VYFVLDINQCSFNTLSSINPNYLESEISPDNVIFNPMAEAFIKMLVVLYVV